MTQSFVWASQDPSPPGRWDLRLLGWSMHKPQAAPQAGSGLPWLLDCRSATYSHDWRQSARPELIAAIGADDEAERAEMLALGIGEALSSRTAVVELAARLNRLVAAADAMPRYRRAGPVTLDLFHRDGQVGERWLGLHPREFELLWRLSDTPGERVSARELLTDVWRLDHVPETNSLQVHVSRLRAKLAISKVAWLVETDPEGGYRLGRNNTTSFFAFSNARQETLDSREVIGNGERAETLIVSRKHASK